jgi:Fic family protein
MRWNWQQPDWPNFAWAPALLVNAEAMFLRGTGVLAGASKHLDQAAHDQVLAETLSLEAVTTSEIEGEMLDRASVQSSIQKHLGISTERRRVGPAEQGISDLMVNLYRGINVPLSHDTLFLWHQMVMSGRSDLRDVGRYRSSAGPMQVVSGPIAARKIHFEAPPSVRVKKEMAAFLQWFKATAPGSADELPALTRAGIAHLYFESIHPFEDGNGRLGRAIAEKALVQGFGQPVIIAFARTVLAHHRAYYAALEAANKQNNVNDWLRWFAAIAIEAQHRTLSLIEFVIHKTKLLDAVREHINERQQKVLLRMLREGPEGFQGGMTAKKYAAIAGTTPATTTRDLAGLVDAGALTRSGELKSTRYALNIPSAKVQSVSISKDGEVRLILPYRTTD